MELPPYIFIVLPITRYIFGMSWNLIAWYMRLRWCASNKNSCCPLLNVGVTSLYFIFVYTHNWVVFWNIVMELFSKAGVSHMRIVAPLYFLSYIPLIIFKTIFVLPRTRWPFGTSWWNLAATCLRLRQYVAYKNDCSPLLTGTFGVTFFQFYF